MNKAKFIKTIKENINKANPIAALMDPNNVKVINTNLDNLKKKFQDLGIVQEDIDETFESGKNYKDDNDFFRDLINHLKGLISTQYNNEESDIKDYIGHKLKIIDSKIEAAEEEIKNNPDKKFEVSPLREPYLDLQNIKKDVSNLRKRFVREGESINPNIFQMIAESETPKISKKEILEFLKNR